MPGQCTGITRLTYYCQRETNPNILQDTVQQPLQPPQPFQSLPAKGESEEKIGKLGTVGNLGVDIVDEKQV